MTNNTFNLTYKDVTDYENILIRMYHCYLSTNYLTELLRLALIALPEDAPAQVLGDLTEEYEVVSDLAKQSAAGWTETYFDMIESNQPLPPAVIDTFRDYDFTMVELAQNMGRIFLYISEVFDQCEHDKILATLDEELASQQVQEQYDQMLSGMYPSLPDNIQAVIDNFKDRANKFLQLSSNNEG